MSIKLHSIGLGFALLFYSPLPILQNQIIDNKKQEIIFNSQQLPIEEIQKEVQATPPAAKNLEIKVPEQKVVTEEIIENVEAKPEQDLKETNAIEFNLTVEDVAHDIDLEALKAANTPILKGVFFTAYNAEVGQTDATPCIAGGTGYNVCEMYKNGENPIALSQELIQWSLYGKNGPFKKGDKVKLVSPEPGCNGIYTVADAMNARYRHRGDFFKLDRKDNISCTVDIYKL